MTTSPTPIDPDEYAAAFEQASLSEPDGDQLSAEDQLIDRGVDDLLDEGYVTVDRPIGMPSIDPDLIAGRVDAEEPEVWDDNYQPAKDVERTGRLIEDDDTNRRQDVFAQDVGFDGGAASAEEAAMHVIDEELVDDDMVDVDVDADESSDESDITADDEVLVDELTAGIVVDEIDLKEDYDL